MERKAEYCLTQIFHYLVNGLAAIVFFCCIAYSGYALWDNWSILKEPDQVREDLIRYKPANEEELSYSFQELKAMNPDPEELKNLFEEETDDIDWTPDEFVSDWNDLHRGEEPLK